MPRSSFTKTIDAGRECTGFKQYAAGEIDSATRIAGTGGVITIQAEAQAIRYRLDGVDPTTTVGTLINVGECHNINVGPDNAHKIIAIAASAGAIANVHSFR